jgi:Ser/Thr protein kinase RdoA (MazF antagonist)
MPISPEIAKQVAESDYGLLVESVEPIFSGRINETFKILAGGKAYCLQRLNDFFEGYPALGENWLKTQTAMLGQDLPFPAIERDLNGELLPKRDGYFRLTHWLKGTAPAAGNIDAARLSGRFLGQCHVALNVPRPLVDLQPLPLKGDFTNQKLVKAEDFDEIFVRYRRHPRLPHLTQTLIRGGKAARRLPGRPTFARVFLARDLAIHADPKRENFLFEGERQALVDWDTVGYGDPLIDLGELCRSFAAVKPDLRFDLDLALSAVEGYRDAGLALGDDIPKLLPAVIRALALRLSYRYLVDALAEVYFSWDKNGFESLSAQCEAKALALLDLAEELEDREMEFTKALA